MALAGHHQLERSVMIEVPLAAVWSVVSDSRLLAEWVPAVETVLSCSPAGEHVGATRSCSARLAGRVGTMNERCIEYEPMTRLAYRIDEESFGMHKMFEHYGFSLDLSEVAPNCTAVSLHTHYTPRNLAYSLLNAAVIRRRMGAVATEIVAGLKTFAETRAAAP